MKTKTSKVIAVFAFLILLLSGVAASAWFGLFNFAADVPHSKFVYSGIELLRERSVRLQAASISVPKLDSEQSIIKGAGNYAAMCAQCHLSPTMKSTELSRGLYPSPPDLTSTAVEPAIAFWTVKHGIKASGMPAWGKSMNDQDIWDMVAFLQKLPRLDSAAYTVLVSSSDGHSHAGTPQPNHDETTGAHAMPGKAPQKPAHVHKPGEAH